MSDIRSAFIDAGQGYLRVLDATMHLVRGPRGEREHQKLRFVGVHGPSNTRFVINADMKLDPHRMGGDFDLMEHPAVPPSAVPGSPGANHGGGTSAHLLESARAAAVMVLKKYAEKARP